MKRILRLRFGFTMMDLTIALAILSILTAIAVPQINRFQARGRQAAGKGDLVQIHAAQKTFRQSFKTYHYWSSIGFLPKAVYVDAGFNFYTYTLDRSRAYAVRRGNVVNPPPTPYATLGLTDPGGEAEEYPAHPSRCPVVGRISATSNTTWSAEAALGAPTGFLSKDSYLATIIGCPLRPLTTTTGLDRWGIDENGNITQLNAGI